MIRAYLALGSNLGDRLAFLQGAVDGLAAAPDVHVVSVSGVYETVPVGGPQQDDFLNAVACVDTTLDPYSLFALAQHLEQRRRLGHRSLCRLHGRRQHGLGVVVPLGGGDRRGKGIDLDDGAGAPRGYSAHLEPLRPQV